MSIKIMSQVWETGPSKQSHLLVMLALADYANDEGTCWPSMASIAHKARITERGARKIVRELEALGWLYIDTGGGRHGCNRYTVNPEQGSPRNDVPPGTAMQKPGTAMQETRNGGSAEPSRTVKEPSVSKTCPIDILCKAVRPETARDFAAHRKAIKKPLTEGAAHRIVAKLKDHHDPDGVLDQSIENGWQGIFPDKVEKPKGKKKEPWEKWL
ncbi:MAG: helix-turn-helix domain-containing protein [Verrucomicrobiales bacterium]|nr:helix-turn-helix domain-containing protein [Verrucomicrobiales bacterium]